LVPPNFNVNRNGAGLFCGCRVWQQLEPRCGLDPADGDRTVSFFDLFYQIDLIKSGMHHPAGMLWIRGPGREPGERSEKVPLTAIAPTILDMYGLEAPDSMRGKPLSAGGREPVAA